MGVETLHSKSRSSILGTGNVCGGVSSAPDSGTIRTTATLIGRTQGQRSSGIGIPMSTSHPGDSQTGSDPRDWVDQHGDALLRYAVVHTHDSGLAEELVQECFLAALGARKQFAARSSERTWLIGILRHKIMDHYRRSSRTPAPHESDMIDAIEPGIFTSAGLWSKSPTRWRGDPKHDAEKREFWEVLRGCLAKLPGPLAEAFLLREMDQMESEEICKVLDLTPTNLWTRLHRARLALRACLEHRWFDRAGRRSGDA
jgi:RNA polymerase sigma-70 factor (ECF subfamily)